MINNNQIPDELKSIISNMQNNMNNKDIGNSQNSNNSFAKWI